MEQLIKIMIFGCFIGMAASAVVPTAEPSFIGRGTSVLATSMLQVAQKNSSNFVFSPLGYSTLLAVLAEGGVGPTSHQIAALLHHPEDPYTVRTTYRALLAPMQERGVANQPEFKNWFYTRKEVTVDDGFKATLEENYFTEVKEIDNSLASPKNETAEPAEEVTTSKEPSSERRDGAKAVEEEIIKTFSERFEDPKKDEKEGSESHSKVICFNALFFNGVWKDKFAEAEGGCIFQSKDGPVVSPCVKSEGDFPMAKLSNLKSDALQIPYQGGRYALFLIVPEADQKLEDVVSKITPEDLCTLDKQLVNKTMKISLPKFKFDTISRPKEALHQNGVEDVYTATMADLSKITGKKQLYLADLVQFLSIEVSEKSASYNYLTATSIGSLRTAVPEFNVNRPFLFFLRDTIENYIVVAGKLENPKTEK